MPAIESKRIVLAVLELTDSTIKLLTAASHREISTKQLLVALKALVARERQTVQRQNKTIENLKRRCALLEEKLKDGKRDLGQSLDHMELSVGNHDATSCEEKVNLPSFADFQRP